MAWSKTTSSGNRVSAGIVVHVLDHTEPQVHRRDPTFNWITGLRPHLPLCRYTLTNLPALTSTQSNSAARTARRLGFALRHSDQSKSGPAGCSREKRVKKEVMDGGKAGRAIWKGGQMTESSVVERGHSTAVAREDSLFWGNLTQSNKGFVVMLSV
ncbi:hypothetical protein CgunFtcFv8_007591 [Champsocephalus gunnari]|uniref:Uncharacterized protein n=1 Tax=Champsocephalus gunnari TaxID=52237 RepID=A0AAN8CHR3_CHAGU|nr:hypothetical protein CgunFtcFv8_007591 [Champsocephalus gunnari]